MLKRQAAALVVGYAFGALPVAASVAKLATRGKVDLSKSGTGNPGAANAIGVLGPAWGGVVLAGDIAKSALAATAGRRIAGPAGAHVASSASVLGHCYPVTTGFRGGKGVACSVGQVLATFPAYFPIDLGIAVLSSAGPWRSRARAATTIASLAWVGGAVHWWRKGLPNLWGPEPTVALPAAAALSSAVILWRFRSVAA